MVVCDDPFGLSKDSKVPASFERLINSAVGDKRSQIGLMASLLILNVTPKSYFNSGSTPSLSQTVHKGHKRTT